MPITQEPTPRAATPCARSGARRVGPRRTPLVLALALAAAAPAGADPTAPLTAVPSQSLRVPGLAAPAQILVDTWGVPHIYARSEDDVFFAQGFNAARDRLFQLDLWRRRGLGRLAAALGPDFVEQDRAARLFLYRGDMRREWLAYGPQAQRIATRFVSGINAYIDLVGRDPARLPIEFDQFGYQPEKWQPEDVVRIRSHGLTRNLASEVWRATMACRSTL
ncbi:MAG: penicillin acylase family protein, partial [Rubrivivax sp.]